MQILHWPVAEELKRETEANYRTGFALSLKNRDPLTIIRELTFDGVVPEVTIADIERLFSFVEESFLKKKLRGVGIEVGAGPATFSAVLARRPEVEKMYAIEICRPIVEQLMPKVVAAVTGQNAGKIIGCVADFDRLNLPDDSVDFVIDFFSLHHSPKLAVTLRESWRVLKPGGVLLAFDKARPDYLSEEDLDLILNKEYDESFKRRIGWPLNEKLTRRMNDEKEYRLVDWRREFNQAEFPYLEHFRLEKTLGRDFLVGFVKRAISLLPPKIQVLFTKFVPRRRDPFDLEWSDVVFTSALNPFRKEMSLLVATKPMFGFRVIGITSKLKLRTVDITKEIPLKQERLRGY